MKISKAVASSVCDGIADDALKDEDNGFWLASLPTQVQAIWQQRFYWIRWVDRLAEQDQVVHPGGAQFPMLYEAWQRLYRQRFLSADDQHWKILQQIEASWFLEDINNVHQVEVEAWNCYMDAIADYHQPVLTIATLRDYEIMLDRLAGACFQLLPFLEDHHRAVARRFGIVDQFYNNLRDLYEDAQQGVCYFPTALLKEFGLERQAILDLSCLEHPGFRPLMEYWVEDYLPRLRQDKLSLMLEPDLHPAWQCLTTWFVHRYIRIEKILRACQYDFVAFAQQYWPAVQQDLTQQMAKVKQFTLTGRPYTLINVAEIAPFLQVSPSSIGVSQYPHGPAVMEGAYR